MKRTRKEERRENVFDVLRELAEEQRISVNDLADKISQAIYKAATKEYPDCDEGDFSVVIDPEHEKLEVSLLRTVVLDEPTYFNEVNIDEARTMFPKCAEGDVVHWPIKPDLFARVAATYAKQSVRHDIKEYEKEKLIAEYEGKVENIASGTVARVDPATGNAMVKVGTHELFLSKNDQIPGEVLEPDDVINVYIVELRNLDRKPTVKISRTYNGFLRRLFEREIPEISEGIVEIMGIAREPGSRAKVAVRSTDPAVDCIGACIGPKRSRIENVMREVKGEKIDLIVYDEDPAVYISKSLAPADVTRVEIDENNERSCTAYVPANQLSLAIG
ncbi:MAG: transcription termination factor NusA, partial [Oscillospiraceae bacterium]|nr:transcription termination factor NusA [Oscillospiraceae bacterium]